MILQLCGQGLMGKVVFCRDEQAGGVLVDAVDDAGAQLTVDTGQAALTVVEQGVDQRTTPMAGGRMDHQSLGLVDHDQIVVLVGHIQRDVLRLQIDLLHWGKVHLKGVLRCGFVIFADCLPVLCDAPVLQKLLCAAAGQIGEQAGQQHIDALAGKLGFNGHGVPPTCWAAKRRYRTRCRRRPRRCPPH